MIEAAFAIASLAAAVFLFAPLLRLLRIHRQDH